MPLCNMQFDAIMRQYDMRQLKNQHIASERRLAVYSQLPRMKEIDDSISELSVRRAKMLLDDNFPKADELKQRIGGLIREKQELLCSNGYPGDYLEPPCTCPDCKDTGYINGHKCHCFLQAEIDSVYTQSNLKRILLEENFDHFRFDYYSDSDRNPATGLSSRATARQTVTRCHDFIDSFDHRFGNLLFYGDTGVGKTFLTHCIAKELLDTGHSVIYFTSFELFDIFETNKFSRSGGASGDYQNIFNCDLLIIDDLGTELSNSFTNSQLFLCLNERILRLKSTIISTNLSLNQLASTYSERTFSRLSSYYDMIKLFGEDIRIQKKLQGQACTSGTGML